MLSTSVQAIFWFAMIPFWILMSYMGKRAMLPKVQSGIVTQDQVNYFAKNFVTIFGVFCALMVIFSFIGGTLGTSLSGALGFLSGIVFLVWLWFFEGIKHFVMFGPFYNMPLKNEKRVKIISTVLVIYLAYGNLSLALHAASN